MKKVFSIILAASMMLLGTVAAAQPSIGVGFANSTDYYKVSGNKENTALNGFYVGGSYNLPIAGALNVAPGIYYSYLTKSDAGNYLGANLKGDVKEHYLTVPVMFNIGMPITGDICARIFAGPSLAYGLASNVKYSGSVTIPVIGTINGDKTINNYDDDYNYRRFDIMLGGGVAVDFYDMVRFKIGYDYGLVNRYSGNGDITRHRGQLSVGVSYLF